MRWQIVEHGPVRLAVQIIGSHPEGLWLSGWLRDLITRERIPPLTPDIAELVAERVKDQWPGERKWWVEVKRTDRQGVYRIDCGADVLH